MQSFSERGNVTNNEKKQHENCEVDELIPKGTGQVQIPGGKFDFLEFSGFCVTRHLASPTFGRGVPVPFRNIQI